MFQDFFSYFRDWLTAPSETSVDIDENGIGGQMALTGFLAGFLFFLLGALFTVMLTDGWNVFWATFPFQLGIVTLFVVFMLIIVVDIILLILWAAMLRAELSIAQAAKVAAFSAVTIVPATFLLVPIDFLGLSFGWHLLAVTLVYWLPHWSYMFASARGIADESMGRTIIGALLSFVILIACLVGGVMVFAYLTQ